MNEKIWDNCCHVFVGTTEKRKRMEMVYVTKLFKEGEEETTCKNGEYC